MVKLHIIIQNKYLLEKYHYLNIFHYLKKYEDIIIIMIIVFLLRKYLY